MVEMPCKDILQLLPVLQRGVNEFLKRCKEAGLNVLVTQTYRSEEYQNFLYAQGRTKPGEIITNCKGGQSPHEFRYAFDICKNVKGHEYDDTNFFGKCGKIWEEMGGTWGGSWTGFVDMPHFQFGAGFTDKQLRTGTKMPNDVKMPWEAKEQKVKGENIMSEMIYNYIDENMPQWAMPTVKKLVDKGYLSGNEKGELGLNETMLKVFVVNDRAGVYK